MPNRAADYGAALERFKSAQESPGGYRAALSEIRAGAKRGHWIWYIFPQLAGLGSSPASRTYGIDGPEEAGAYLRDPLLGSRLLEITQAVARQAERIPLVRLMGSEIDVLKLVSSLTLFRAIEATAGVSNTAAFRAAADAVLAAASAQGYPPCAYTLDRLAHSGRA